MSAASGAVAVLAVLSVHGVPMLIRCVGSAPPPRREVVGILNAVFQSVRQQALGAAGEGAGGDAAECAPAPPRPAAGLRLTRALCAVLRAGRRCCCSSCAARTPA